MTAEQAEAMIEYVIAAPSQLEGGLPEPDFALDGGSTHCYYAETIRAILEVKND